MSKLILADAHPELAKQWHSSKNGDLTPSDVTCGSSRKVWWVCPTNPKHEWNTRVNNRVKGRGCPFCAGKRKFGFVYQTLAEAFPDLTKEWHRTKNGDLTPSDVTEGSGKVVWWQCSKDSTHEWKARIQNRTGGRGNCPKCGGRIPSKKTSLAERYPHIAKQWHPIKNGELTPNDVFPNSKIRVWWQCIENPEHQWQAKISSRIQTQGNCRFCLRKNPIRKPSLAEYDPELAKEWHPKKNAGKTPNDVTAGSNFKAWWVCRENPNHIWRTTVGNRSSGKGCPFCAGQVPGDRNLAVLYPEIAKEWHPTRNGDLTPELVTPGSARRVWWQCSIDSAHEWQAYIFGRVKGVGRCPACSGAGKKSFAEVYPDEAKEWHPIKNNELTPEDISHGTHQKYWWQCSINPEHEWQASAQNRGINQSGCPICYRERAGQELTDYLLDSVEANTEFYKNFQDGIENILKLSQIRLDNPNLRRTFLGMLFANTITLMETYLSDAFTITVQRDPNLVQKLVETNPYFDSMKLTVSQLYNWMGRIEKEVTAYLQENVIYHNIWKVRPMYESVLGIEFPEDLVDLQRSIMTRHDIVHRNGKTKDGTPINLSIDDIEKNTKLISDFVTFIDNQFQSLSNPFP